MYTSCDDCGGVMRGGECPMCVQREEQRKARNRRVNTARKTREGIMRSMGLTKVRGALGGTYWE